MTDKMIKVIRIDLYRLWIGSMWFIWLVVQDKYFMALAFIVLFYVVNVVGIMRRKDE